MITEVSMGLISFVFTRNISIIFYLNGILQMMLIMVAYQWMNFLLI